MIGLIIVACLVLIGIITVQIARMTELFSSIRGERQSQLKSNRANANGLVVFMVLFLVASAASAMYYKNYMLGYGPHESASAHGLALDRIFNITLFFTGIIFFATQIVLFWFAYKYKETKNSRSYHFSHDNKLEIVWTAIPAVVMTFLVVGGLDAWNTTMSDIPEEYTTKLIPQAEDEYIEIEATGYQFAWDIRYPGNDGVLGTKDFRLISGTNPLGQDWNDKKNLDDFLPGEIVLPVGKTVRVRITSKDVLHNFYLPHFRVKMDAVPGMPTYFVFTPEVTTKEYRERLKNTPEYNQPDPDTPEKMKWETFEYELACAELCGRSHFSMRRIVKVVDDIEYRQWLQQNNKPFYLSQVRGTDDDPYKDELLDFEVKERKEDFDGRAEAALSAVEEADKTVLLKYVTYETGSANLEALSRYELGNVAAFLKRHPEVKIELAGHTDATGNSDTNMSLSQNRARTAYDFLINNEGIAAERLVWAGYGASRPIDSNDTEEGRAKNRRTEFKIIAQ